MFSKACEYSIRASIFIAKQSMNGKRANLKEISDSIASPEAFTAKLLQKLVRCKIIESVMGTQGGFQISKERIPAIKLSDIVVAIDGDRIYNICSIGLKVCSEINPCPVHHKYKVIQKALKDMLENTNLSELTNGLNLGLTTLKI